MSKVKDPASEVPSSGEKGILPGVMPDNDAVALARLVSRVLYTVRYKSVRGVEQSFVTASTPAIAQDVAKAWVNGHPGRLFLSLTPSIVADETILRTHKPEPKEPATAELSRQ